MCLKEWNRLLGQLPEDTPVIFYQSAEKPLLSGTYCDGIDVTASRMWEGKRGWVPCVVVTLGEAF